MKVVEAREEVRGWAESVLDGVTVVNSLPVDDTAVSIYPLALTKCEQLSATTEVPFRYSMTFLVTAQGVAAETNLSRLLAGALGRTEWSVDLEPIEPELWRALSVPPCPSFRLHVEASIFDPAPSSPRVSKSLRATMVPTRELRGSVTGPGDIGIPGTRIEIAGLNTYTISDGSGHFMFPNVPGTDDELNLRIIAKGQEFGARIDLGSSKPTVIRCNLEEN